MGILTLTYHWQTPEGTRFQLMSKSATSHAVVVSTVMEAWGVVNSGLVAEGLVKDVRNDHQKSGPMT